MIHNKKVAVTGDTKNSRVMIATMMTMANQMAGYDIVDNAIKHLHGKYIYDDVVHAKKKKKKGFNPDQFGRKNKRQFYKCKVGH